MLERGTELCHAKFRQAHVIHLPLSTKGQTLTASNIGEYHLEIDAGLGRAWASNSIGVGKPISAKRMVMYNDRVLRAPEACNITSFWFCFCFYSFEWSWARKRPRFRWKIGKKANFLLTGLSFCERPSEELNLFFVSTSFTVALYFSVSQVCVMQEFCPPSVPDLKPSRRFQSWNHVIIRAGSQHFVLFAF